MSAQEARECADAIKGNLGSLRSMLLNLERRRGWEALGYSSWRECAQKEFRQSQGYVYKLLHAAEVEENLSASRVIQLDKTEPIPINHLEELHKLPPEQQAVGLRKADELAAAEGKQRTATHVTQAVKEINRSTNTSSKNYEDLARFEAIATTLVNEPSIEPEPVEEFEQALESDNGTPKSVETPAAVTASKSKELMPFHCLMNQQQRERLFTAINRAKSSYKLKTTAEALDVIAEDYLNA